jgi:hypothetical protein
MLRVFGNLRVIVGLAVNAVVAASAVYGAGLDGAYEHSIDDVPIVAPRVRSMAEAATPFVDGFDALYYNPAGIDGNTYYGEMPKKNFIRHLYLPRVGAVANQNAVGMNSEFSRSGATTNSDKGSVLVKDFEGKHAYGRFSLSPVGLFLGSFAVVPVMDQQISAIPSSDPNSDIKFHYRNFNGTLVGWSLTDPKNRYFSFGVSSAVGVIDDVNTSSSYKTLVNATDRDEVFKANSKTYDLSTQCFGLNITPPKKWNPRMSLVLRNFKNVEMTASDGVSKLAIKEDVTAAIGLAPRIGKMGRFKMSVEGTHLTDSSYSLQDKPRVGMEVTFGSSEDSQALFGLRSGYQATGASGGLHLNLGLIGFEASTYAVEIGSKDERNVERRGSITLFIDPGSF